VLINALIVQGLGTSTATDAKKYFGAMKQHRLPFKTATQDDRDLIDMAFNKKKADHRKDWLRGFVVRSFFYSTEYYFKLK
jgi:DNA topoisomerase-2